MKGKNSRTVVNKKPQPASVFAMPGTCRNELTFAHIPADAHAPSRNPHARPSGPEVMSVTCAVAILQLSVHLFHRTEPSARLRMSGELLFRACSWAWVLPTLRAAEPGSAGDCFNPLFQPHWAGKSDIRHLASRPTVQNSLNLCPIWNLRPACCTVLSAFA